MTEAAEGLQKTNGAPALRSVPALEANAVWRAVEPHDVQRIKCDIGTQSCVEQGVWATRTGPPFSYVCDHHRRVYDATGTFWKEMPIPTSEPAMG